MYDEEYQLKRKQAEALRQLSVREHQRNEVAAILLLLLVVVTGLCVLVWKVAVP